MTLWKKEKLKSAQELIDWLLSIKTNSGWPIDWDSIVAFAELSSSSSHSGLNESAIMQVLGKMSIEGKRTVDDFEIAFEEQLKINAMAASKFRGHWNFFIPIEIKLNSDIHQSTKIRILRKDFTFISLASVTRRIDKESRKILNDPKTILLKTGVSMTHTPNVFLTVSSHGESWESAWKNIEPAFDALRGLIELSFGLYGWRVTSRGMSARRKIPHPLWLIAFRKGDVAQWVHFIAEEETSTNIFDLNESRLTSIKKNAVFLKREVQPQSTLSLIADCLRLYSQAMDARFRHLCLLGFWQLAEAITHSESVGGKTDKVAARLAWHSAKIGLKGSGYKETLVALGYKRNDIVHRGLHDVEDNDVNILKLACEVALIWLFQIHKSLPTVAHVEHFYRFREADKNDLDAIKESVAFLSRQNRN